MVQFGWLTGCLFVCLLLLVFWLIVVDRGTVCLFGWLLLLLLVAVVVVVVVVVVAVVVVVVSCTSGR